MKDFSRYFTPLFTAADRQAFSRALGLDQDVWRLEESCGGNVLRRWSELTGPTWQKPETTGTEYDFASLGPQLKVAPFRAETELWRELLPFPLRALPADLPEATQMAEAWSEVETALCAFELSVVWVGTPDVGMPLLFHYVRRRCVRFGTIETLNDIGQNCLSGDWEGATLQAHFGTRTGFFHWSAEGAPQGPALQRLRHIWRTCLPVAVFQSTHPTIQPSPEL